MTTSTLRRASLIACLITACSQAADPAHPSTQSEPSPLTAAAFQRPLIRLPLPDAAQYGQLESLIDVPTGYAALYRKPLGEGKLQNGWEHRVFLSSDGLHWDEASMPATQSFVSLRTLAYGAGRYVLAGASGVERAAISYSSDAVSWRELASDLPAVLHLEFVNDRFFALAQLRGIYTSRDGERFSGAQTDAVQLSDLAYGAGTYVAVGSGPIEVSRDAASWSPVALDCNLPEACVTPPGAAPIQGYRSRVFFGGGRFYAGHFTSSDAQAWTVIADETRVPDAYIAPFLLRLDTANARLLGWQHDNDTLQTTALTDDNPDNLDCRAHRCLRLATQLLLVP